MLFLQDLHQKSKHSVLNPCEHPTNPQPNGNLFKSYNNTHYLYINDIRHNPDFSMIVNILESAFSITRIEQFDNKEYLYHAYAGSGNLHTCEIYIVLNNGKLYHYNVIDNVLELKKILSLPDENQDYYVIMTTVIDRQSIRYGDRGFRYALLDLGHALGALIYAASGSEMILQRYYFTDMQIVSLLDLHVEIECDASIETEIGIVIKLSHKNLPLINKPTNLLLLQPDIPCFGTLHPTRLKKFHWDFSRIMIASTDKIKPLWINPITGTLEKPISARISAKEFSHNATGIAISVLQDFFEKSVLSLIEILTYSCYDSLALEYILIIHNVSGLSPGIYNVSIQYEINHVQINFILNKIGNYRDDAFYLGCFQDICRDCDFQLVMLNKIEQQIEHFESGFYRDIHYTCGMFAHILQIESLRYNINSRPIGAYFDDELIVMLNVSPAEYAIIHVIVFGSTP